MSFRGRAVVTGLAVALLFCLPLLPEILGKRRLVFRDAHVTHWPLRRVAMQSLAAGEVPFVNEFASGGQPLLANPNAVLLYPTILLEKVLSPASAFNLHYILHIFWAFFGARALASRLGQSEGAAFFAGVAYAFSGMMLSYASAFANSGAAAAWLPWCAAATLDLVRAAGAKRLVRAGAALGIAFGLQFLAGEPAISLLTVLSCGVLGLVECFADWTNARARVAALAGGGTVAGVVALLFSAPLLLPLLDVLPFTYRGQHLYSKRAFGASPFAAWRFVEWLFPRFNGDPDVIGPAGHWQFALHPGDLVYIWCVTLGVIPLMLVACAATRRSFWKGWAAWVATYGTTALLFAFGTSLPLFRSLFAVESLRRLRYPIKFYLLTTLSGALLAGLAAEHLRRRSAGRPERAVLVAFALLFLGALLVSTPGGPLDSWVAPSVQGLAWPEPDVLAAVRRTFRGDAILGLLAVAVTALALLAGPRLRGRFTLLGLATLLLSLVWGLPLFVSADQRDLARPPALLQHLTGSGRLYVDPRGQMETPPPARVSRLARVQIEELVPSTGAAFGVRSIFDADPDGSFGWFNRVAGEALTVSTPPEKSRLLRAFGARWVLAEEAVTYPQFQPVTGFSVAGRRLALSEVAEPLPELRWASRDRRVASLSGALDILRTEAFHAETDVLLPGAPGAAPPAESAPARVAPVEIRADLATADVEAGAPGHVVFSRTYFRTWKAALDGRPVPVLVANARELAVAVPSGRHRVAFWWDRGPFDRGVALQIAALASIAVGLILSRAHPAAG